jgi:molybdopterin-guanine dinucleotide biosynthesis protein A
MQLLAGIFVGGRASRFGGIAKGLLTAPDGTPIVVRTRRLLEELGASCVLVGVHPAYDEVELEVVSDDPAAEGPLAGLLSLLDHAKGRTTIAVACDMPLLTHDLLRRLIDAPPATFVAPRHAVSVTLGRAPPPPNPPKTSPRSTAFRVDSDRERPNGRPHDRASRRDAHREVWEPLFARYDAARMLPIARAFAAGGGRKLQDLLDAANGQSLVLAPSELAFLHDWDEPSDLPRPDASSLPDDVTRGRRGE